MLTKNEIENMLKMSNKNSDIIVDKYVEKIVAVLDILKVVDFADYSFVLTDHKTDKRTEVIKRNQHYSYSYDENVDHIKQKNRDPVSFSEEMDLGDNQVPVLKSEKCNLVNQVSDKQSGKMNDDTNAKSDLQISNKQVDTSNVNSDKKTDIKLLDLHKNLYQNCKTLMQQTAGYYKTQMNLFPVLNKNQREDVKGLMKKTQHGFFSPQELQKRCKLSSSDFLNQITEFPDFSGKQTRIYLPQVVCKVLEDKTFHVNFKKDTNKVLVLAESMFGKKYQTKQRELIQQVHAFVPQVSDFKAGGKARNILKQYNIIKSAKKLQKAKNISDANMTECLNQLRHQCTNYDQGLTLINQIGDLSVEQHLYAYICDKVFNAMINKYSIVRNKLEQQRTEHLDRVFI